MYYDKTTENDGTKQGDTKQKTTWYRPKKMLQLTACNSGQVTREHNVLTSILGDTVKKWFFFLKN